VVCGVLDVDELIELTLELLEHRSGGSGHPQFHAPHDEMLDLIGYRTPHLRLQRQHHRIDDLVRGLAQRSGKLLDEFVWIELIEQLLRRSDLRCQRINHLRSHFRR